MSEIWNRVYSGDPSFFGTEPSNFGLNCHEEFKKHGLKKILELGCGQGRDTLYFVSKGIVVKASSLLSLSAVFGLFFAVMLLNEHIGIYQLIAVIVMVTGVYFMYKNEPNVQGKR